jgi:O-antigen/teichoic acid export membrane protein
MLMAMAKLMDTQQVGYYTLALSITNPIMMFSMLQLRAMHVTDVKEQYSYGNYLGVRLLTNGLAAVVLAIVLLILTGQYEGLVYGVIFLVFFNKAIESTSDISYAVMQKHERLDKVAKSMMLRQAGGAAVLIVVLWLTGSILWAVAAIGLWWLAILLFYDRKNVKSFSDWKPQWNFMAFKVILLTGIPLGITRGLISLNESVPRYFVEGYMGTSTQGIFSAMAYTMTVAYLCMEALGYSAVARLAQYYVKNRKSYIKLLLKVVFVSLMTGLIPILIALVAGRQILALLYNEVYAQQPGVFVLLLVVAAGKMVSSMLNHGMNAARCFKVQVPLNLISLVVVVINCMWLIPLYGLMGAALAMLIGVLTKISGSILILFYAIKKRQ